MAETPPDMHRGGVDLTRPYYIGGIEIGSSITGRPFESPTHGPCVQFRLHDGQTIDLDQEAAEALCRRTMAVFHPEDWQS